MASAASLVANLFPVSESVNRRWRAGRTVSPEVLSRSREDREGVFAALGSGAAGRGKGSKEGRKAGGLAVEGGSYSVRFLASLAKVSPARSREILSPLRLGVFARRKDLAAQRPPSARPCVESSARRLRRCSDLFVEEFWGEVRAVFP